MTAPEIPLRWCAACNAWHTARPHDDGSISTPDDTRPVSYVDLSHVPPLRAGDTLILRDAVLVGSDGAVGLNPSPHWEVVRQDAPLCGQDTREAGSRVTVQCALPVGHAGMCSAEEEEEGAHEHA